MKKTVYISGDHAGFELKEQIKIFLSKKGYKFKDFGPSVIDKDDDYPDYVIPMAKAISKDKNTIGFIFAGSGNGEAMVANRTKGVRAAVYYGKNLEIVKKSREHNDANILSIGARFIKQKEAEEAIEVFLATKFSGGRHLRRLKKF